MSFRLLILEAGMKQPLPAEDPASPGNEPFALAPPPVGGSQRKLQPLMAGREND
jgi:hypothetical protein